MLKTFKIEDTIRNRVSVRNYQDKELGVAMQNDIRSFMTSLNNPFNTAVNFHMLDKMDHFKHQKLGTYGVIKGANHYIGATITLEALSLEALGYEFETMILYLTSLGLGTCWLGGTFNRKAFAGAMNVNDDELFPIIVPYGYSASNKHITEIAMRKIAKSDHRKPWNQLFYNNDFASPLTKEAAKEFLLPLEMVRLGPSASNKQPWRIVLIDHAFHFFEYKEPGYSTVFSYDIQRIDMGIAAAHFDLTIEEMGIKGHFDSSKAPIIKLPEHVEYVFSWIRD